MSHIQQTITLLEQELEVTQGRCHELTRAIETLRPLAGDVVPSRGAGGRRIYAPGTRQKAAPRTVKPGAEPAWWVQHAAADAPRDGFSTAAAARDAEMRETSSTWRSTTKPNSVV